MWERQGAPRADWPAVRRLLAESWNHWNNVDAMRMSASLSFYTVMSMAPLLIIAVGIAGLVFGPAAAQNEIVGKLRSQLGPVGALEVQSILKSAGSAYSGYISTVLGFLVLLFSASGVFTELQDTLDRVWGVRSPASAGWMGMLQERAWAFLMVLGIGVLLLCSLVASTFITAAGAGFHATFPLPPFLLQVINFTISGIAIAVLFGVIYKIVPNVAIRWQDVWLGALITSVLFTIGKQLLGIYLGRASISSPYGAAGSLVVLLLWLYYSAQIFFLGAVFTRLFCERHGSRFRVPERAKRPDNLRSMPRRSTG